MKPPHTDGGGQVFDKILTWFANLWFAFALLCMVADIAVIIYTASSTLSGYEVVMDKWSPLNVMHFIVGPIIVGLFFYGQVFLPSTGECPRNTCRS
jgi:hypothetical protein